MKKEKKKVNMSLIKLYKNRGKILEGIKNKIFKQEHIEEIAKSRMEICVKCSFIDKKGNECYVAGTQPCCGKCGCSLSLKLRSLSSGCGDEENPKWDAVVDQLEEEMIEDSLNLEEK